MKIKLLDIIASENQTTGNYDKIVLTNGEYFYPHDQSENEYHELVIKALEENSTKIGSWKITSNSPHKNNPDIKKQILEHVTRSRNILTYKSDALTVLHHSAYTLNTDSEIIPLSSKLRAEIIKKIYAYSSEGNRVSGISIKKIESKTSSTTDFYNGIFIALVLRKYILPKTTSRTADKNQKSKISTKIFSKELLPTCKWYARKIGVHASDDFCITSDALQSMDDAELSRHLNHTTIFAQMRPLDFERVSRLLTANGHELIN
ncbi:MAG: hypothetical protein AAB649_07540 [Patescibacteria group bacterium]